jgi:hypothetical protein
MFLLESRRRLRFSSREKDSNSMSAEDDQTKVDPTSLGVVGFDSDKAENSSGR